jgi:hypothetical protein
MPRPIVEVRQTVLDPVITINDPQQEVCIIGLHTEDYVDQQVHEVDLPSTKAAGVAIHQAAGAQVEFTLDVNGVFLDANIDFGPDEFDVSDNQEIKFSEAWYSDAEIDSASNIANDLSGYSSVVTLGVAPNPSLNGLVATSRAVKLVAQPVSTHFNKLVHASGDAVDFSTHADFVNIVQGSEITFDTADGNASSEFIVLRKDSDAIYLRGKDAANHDRLVTGNAHFALDGLAADSFFSLVHPGVHEVEVANINGTVVTCASALPFAITVDEKADFAGALLVQVAEEDLADLATDEAGGNLTVDNTGTGDADITLKAAAMEYSGKAIVRAKLTMSYTVARTDLSAGLTRVDQNTYSAVLGGSTPRNPLALAAELALLNSGSSSVNVLALDLTPIIGETEPKSVETAFTDALAIVNRHATTYAMVPLTNSPTVTKAYANAAEALSVARKGQFRICIGSSKGAPQADFIVGSPSSPAKFGLTTQVDAVTFKSKVTNSAGDFYRLPSGKVLTNDVITAQDDAGKTYVGTVTDATNTELSVTWDNADNYPADATELTSYYVSRSLLAPTKIERQIEILTAEANAIASKRLFLTFPGACTVESGSGVFVGVPSYYISAAFSGLMARLEIHRPKNFLGLAGVSGLQDFSRFSDDQLDQISDAGYLVFQQEEATSAPFCVHQINTYHGVAAGTQEYTELSVIANFDFVSRYLKEVLDPFAGTVNIVPSTFGVIQASLDSAMDNLASRRVSTIGAPLISGTVEFVRQASYDSGTIEANVLVSLPKVLNKIILEVVSG